VTRFPFTLILFAAALGCGREYQDNTPTPPPAMVYVAPTVTTLPTATITGTVTWAGEPPTVPPINGLIRNRDGSKWGDVPNHFAPKIDPKSRGIAGAVVWLTGVDPAKAKPWPYPPLTVEARDYRIRVLQGDKTNPVGFVRVGDALTITSADSDYHMIRARGAATFTLAFLKPSAPTRRKLDHIGQVEFTSGAGYFWSAADVFVCDHPYFAATDDAGKFRFDHVPPGEYEAVAWLRNWRLLSADRDPETGRTMRLTFAEPLTMRSKVTATEGTTTELKLPLPR